ncbi:MAG: hypothetical protein GTO48_13225, partial [Xanthomonadales bacterium]|nr:hypothetical protein [Xanthomonadales bacterium]NIO14330.1 hypothetical protein [Xanthomonadales bacterium]
MADGVVFSLVPGNVQLNLQPLHLLFGFFDAQLRGISLLGALEALLMDLLGALALLLKQAGLVVHVYGQPVPVALGLLELPGYVLELLDLLQGLFHECRAEEDSKEKRPELFRDRAAQASGGCVQPPRSGAVRRRQC